MSWLRPAVCLLCLALPAPAQIVAPPAAPLPTLDGRLDDPCWQAGAWSTGFHVLSRPGQPAAPQTAFQVRHGGGRLWLALRADEPRTADLKQTVTERDGAVYHDDCLEVMLDPTGERVEYFHLVVNPAGTIYDAQVRQGGQVSTMAWNGDVAVKTAVGDGAWTVELSLPLADLGLHAASLGDWSINVARERQVTGRTELSTFAPLSGGFHQPAQFAALTLQDADLRPYLWEVREPYDQQVSDTGAGLAWQATTYLTNQTGRFRFLVLEAVLAMADGTVTQQRVTRGLDAGQGAPIPLQVPVETQGPGVLTSRILDRASGEAWAIHQTPVAIRYTPLAITLTQPAYRQTIYATMDLAAVTGTVTCGLTAAQRRGGTLVVELLAGERVVATSPPDAEVAASEAFRLPVADLPVGDYTIRASFAAGDRRHETTTPLHKVAPAEHEIRIDEHQVVRVNGRPYLPFGWFSLSAADYRQAADAGFNALIDYGAQWRKLPEQLAFLDAVAAAGLRVAFYPYPNAAMMEKARWAEPLRDDEAAAIRERVDALKHHPAVLAWYLADEPELRPALPARLERIREVIADADPYHPCIMLNDTIAGIHKYAGGGEILMPDPYPLFIKGGAAAQDLAKTSAFMRAVQESAAGWRAAWITPQAFNYGDYGRVNNRVPNLAELRNQWHQAICQRTTGALWYTYGQRGNYPELSLGMDFLAAETRLLEPWILAVETADPRPVTPAESGLQADWRTTPAGQCLFAVNTSTEPRDALIALPQNAAATWYVVSENRQVANVDGKLADRFEPYATHVYTTVREVATALSLVEVEAQIDAANARREKPGNLAFEARGTSVSVSSRSTYGSTPDRVVDGVLDGMRWRDGTPDKFPDWLTITFAEPATIARVVVYSPDIGTATIECPEGDGWRTLGTLQRTDDQRLEATFTARSVTALRVLVTASAGRDVTITEVEAYAQ